MHTLKNLTRTLLAAAILVTAVTAAEPSYVGKWKINTGKDLRRAA